MRLFAMDFFVLSFFGLSVRCRLFCFVAVVNDDDDVEFCVAPFSFVSQLLMLPIRIISLLLSVGMRFPCDQNKIYNKYFVIVLLTIVLIAQVWNFDFAKLRFTLQILHNKIQTYCKLGNSFVLLFFFFSFSFRLQYTNKCHCKEILFFSFSFSLFYLIFSVWTIGL